MTVTGVHCRVLVAIPVQSYLLRSLSYRPLKRHVAVTDEEPGTESSSKYTISLPASLQR